MEYFETILDTIGNTPLVRLHRVVEGLEGLFLAKLEFFNPGGSVKDRIALSMIESLEKEGKLKKGGTIVEGTSGNTGVGLALVAAVRGYRCIFTITDKQSPEKIRLLKALGAEVVTCPTAVLPTHPDSYYSVARRIHKETPGSVYPNQYENPENPLSHYRTTGPEIWRQTEGRVTHFFAGVGTGGTISGVGKFLKERNPSIRVIGIDPEGSVLKDVKETGIYRPETARPYKVEGIGEDIVPTTLWFDVIDEFVRVQDRESFLMARRLAREEGIFAGGSAGAAVAGMVKYLRKNPPRKGDVVVVLLPDWGEHYTSKFYSDEWMKENGYLRPPSSQTLGDLLLPHERGAIVTISALDPVRKGIELLNRHGFNQLPVLGEGEKIVGTLLEGEVLSRALSDPRVLEGPVVEVMSPPLPILEVEDGVDLAVDLLKENPALLVREGARVVGIVTRYDLVRFLAGR